MFKSVYEACELNQIYAITEGTAIMGNMATRVKFGEKHENLKLDGY